MSWELVIFAGVSTTAAAVALTRAMRVVQRFAVETAKSEDVAEQMPIRPWHKRNDACSLCAQNSLVLGVRCKAGFLYWYCPVCRGQYRTPFKEVS
jgi:hypothetical protein